MTTKPHLLIVSHSLQPPGGGKALAAWGVQALSAHYRLTVATVDAIDRRAINRSYGTRLAAGDFRHIRLLQHFGWLDWLPLPLAQLRLHLVMREVQEYAHAYEAIVSFDNEAYFGRKSIQYVHFPWAEWVRPAHEVRWYHLPILRRWYLRATQGLSGYSKVRCARNLTLCNSAYVAGVFEDNYGVAPRVLRPPGQGGYREVPWALRPDRFVAIGRLCPEKRFDDVVDILDGVRRAGHDVQLTIVGQPDHPDVQEALVRKIAPLADWVRLHTDLPRAALDAILANARYGIHAVHAEHYGMAVAEMVLAGRIVFVHNSGGQTEIVGHNPALCFKNKDDAVQKILGVLESTQLQQQLLADLAKNKAELTRDAFCAGLKRHVAGFLGSEA